MQGQRAPTRTNQALHSGPAPGRLRLFAADGIQDVDAVRGQPRWLLLDRSGRSVAYQHDASWPNPARQPVGLVPGPVNSVTRASGQTANQGHSARRASGRTPMSPRRTRRTTPARRVNPWGWAAGVQRHLRVDGRDLKGPFRTALLAPARGGEDGVQEARSITRRPDHSLPGPRPCHLHRPCAAARVLGPEASRVPGPGVSRAHRSGGLLISDLRTSSTLTRARGGDGSSDGLEVVTRGARLPVRQGAARRTSHDWVAGRAEGLL